MKLKSFLKTTKNPAVAARKVIEGKLDKLYKILKKRGWNVDTDKLVDILNNLFEKNNLIFFNSHKVTKEPVESAYFVTQNDMFSEIEVGLSKKAGRYFRKFSRVEKKNHFFDIMKNDFIAILISYLTHELRHYQQFQKSGKNPSTDGKTGFDYLSNPSEVDAYAQQAAIETLKGGQSNTVKMFFAYTEIDKNDTADEKRKKKNLRKRFLKKYNKALDQYK